MLRRGTNRRYVGGKVNITSTSKLEGNDFVMTLWFPVSGVTRSPDRIVYCRMFIVNRKHS